MAMQQHYPYTDLHELNLDYVLQRIQVLERKIDYLNTKVPEPPQTAGTYRLKATVAANGTVTYKWEV